jgi:cyclophilin family peptidyl-prolyl cis-trans isomerase
MKLITLMTFALMLTGCFESQNEAKIQTSPAKEITENIARIKTTHGDIVFEFLKEDAPNTSARIKQLIKEGFYNGLIFHRVIPGFVVQGGDPTGMGTGGSGKKLKAEFNQNKHIPGTVAMARAQDINSADSQFYISTGTHPHLDGKYTVFGKVKEGLDVANKVQQGDKMITVTLE